MFVASYSLECVLAFSLTATYIWRNIFSYGLSPADEKFWRGNSSDHSLDFQTIFYIKILRSVATGTGFKLFSCICRRRHTNQCFTQYPPKLIGRIKTRFKNTSRFYSFCGCSSYKYAGQIARDFSDNQHTTIDNNFSKNCLSGTPDHVGHKRDARNVLWLSRTVKRIQRSFLLLLLLLFYYYFDCTTLLGTEKFKCYPHIYKYI